MLQVDVRRRRADFELDAAFQAATPGVVALFGRAGCGKTTLVNIIAGLLRPDAGSVRLHDVTWVDVAARRELPAERRRVGYVFQDARLFPHLTVHGNLVYGQRRAPVAAGIDLPHTVDLLGLGALLERRPHELSGGERQRVALGRALLSQPQLLLMDEPLASLDAPRREELLPYFEALRDRLRVPIVYVSHQFDEVLRLADHVVVMDAGRVAVQGDIGTVSRSPALRAIVGLDAVGAVLDAEVIDTDTAGGLTALRVGNGTLRVAGAGLLRGARLRVQLMARDIILATQEPHGLSVRNSLPGVVRTISPGEGSDVIDVDIGGASVLANITRAATQALALAPGTPVWALVKAVSMRGQLRTAR